MKFKVLLPSLAFAEFKVMDKDMYGDDDLVGIRTVPFTCLTNGGFFKISSNL